MSKRSHPLKTQTLEQLFNTKFTERQILIDPWLRTGESAMIFAAPSIGKSMMVLSIALALAIAGGGTYIGWKAPKARKVLLVDGEMHIQDLTDRAKMLIKTIADIDSELAKRNITILARQHQHPHSKFPDLATSDGREELFKRAESGNYDLIILDNFSTLATVEDENSAAAFDPIIKFLLQMKQAGKACILVHHSKKGGNDYRGSSKLATTFEVIIGLSKPTTEERLYGTAFDMEWTKFRQKRNENVTGRTVWLEQDEDGHSQWQTQLSADEESTELVCTVTTLKYSHQTDIATALSWSKSKVTRMKQQAIQNGLITKSDWDECLDAARQIQDEVNLEF